jgi:hypothetical protein
MRAGGPTGELAQVRLLPPLLGRVGHILDGSRGKYLRTPHLRRLRSN